jgi:hypothetical protein
LCNEAAVALAFAVVKLRGTCPADVVEIALGALQRMAIWVKHCDMSIEQNASWCDAIGKMEHTLRSMRQSKA